MALLCAQVDADIFQLAGRRGSDFMPRYLHVQAQPVMHNFSRLMVQGGQFSLIPFPTSRILKLLKLSPSNVIPSTLAIRLSYLFPDSTFISFAPSFSAQGLAGAYHRHVYSS
jgi:hypothetical protein